jgi:hypothetical protein
VAGRTGAREISQLILDIDASDNSGHLGEATIFVANKNPMSLNVNGIILTGAAVPLGGNYQTHPRFGGFAITGPVDGDQFHKWLDHNRESAMVVNRMIVWADTLDECKALCREARSGRSGLEPAGGQGVR